MPLCATPIEDSRPVDPQDYNRAILNVLADFNEEKLLLQNMQRAVLNVLDDAESDKNWLKANHRAVLNILEDAESDKHRLDGTQRALLNVLGDTEEDKSQLQSTQRALLNILDDVDTERRERTHAESQVRALNGDLEQRVAQRTGELSAANQELETFAYSVSHDLRTPLRAIEGFSAILEEDYGNKLDAEGRRVLGVVRDGTRKMAQLIDDILAFSRIGRSDMTMTAVDMNALVQDVLHELAPAMSSRDVRVVVPDLPPARGDRMMLRRVWQNLFDNAIKYTGRREAAVIEVTSDAGATEVAYHIKDNGVGFDMRYVEKLFGVFRRLHGPSEFSGSGIGLAIVKRIVTRHGGRVWAEGSPDQGATFHVALPAMEMGNA